jgi:carbonic anhydrase/acetyltransferase-like protein (isoleucine patch superfamily)
MAVYRLGEHTPELGAGVWVAESAQVIGRVTLEDEVSIWFNAVLRGDSDHLTIGAGSNIQDGSVLHADAGMPLTLGRNVTVGHQVMLHGCTVGDNALIGIGAVVLNGARIGANCLVGAGSLVTEGKAFPDGSLIMGSPAKVVRALTPEQIQSLAMSAVHYVRNGRRYAEELVRIDDPRSAPRSPEFKGVP